MLKYVNLARVENLSNEMTPEELQHYHVQLQCLIGSTEGTIPGSRGFGITRDALSQPSPIARNMISMDITRKVDIYIPEIDVFRTVGTINEGNPTDGTLNMDIQIERRI